MKCFIRMISRMVSFWVIVFSAAFSQNQSPEISSEQKFAIIKSAIALLEENYVFPAKAKQLKQSLMEKYNSKGYDNIKKGEAFLEALNHDLEAITADKHVNVFFNPERVRQINEEKKNEGKKVPITPEWRERLYYENFRLRKVERLDGNIGYFKFLNFTELELSKESIHAAMTFVAHSNALIIDLRDNGGGHSETMLYVLSFFLPDQTKIAEFHYRKNDRIEEVKIMSDPSVKKIPTDVPVYILVNKKTSSAAEGLASTLQSFGRAVIVGEITKGEGNPGELFVINEQMYIMIPTAISKSAVPNAAVVEGNGVQPDFVITPDKAQEKALLEICKKLAMSSVVKEQKQTYQWQIPMWEYAITPSPVPENLTEKICGTYNEGRQLLYDNEVFYYINKDKQRNKLTYYGNNIFAIDGKAFVRLRIPAHEEKIKYFEFVWDDGFVERIPRVN